ncbi:MAG: ABC-F family ATP-binding cassette domain-containing protein [Bacteroidales bacterium]|jgi:ATP-binding cassette subfamily F protein 3|nr:ABC-F family ATP-binding cassette domain-containing protein [Bacteroidales bacterium]
MISLSNLAVRFGGYTLFENISVLITEHDKIGLVGRNGAGKSTLLKIIAGCDEASEGSVIVPENCKIGYLPQQMKVSNNKTVFDEARSAFDDINARTQELERLQNELAERTDYESDAYMQLIHKMSEISDYLQLHNEGSVDGEIEQMLTGLGFMRSDFNRPTAEFSGGWRMRIELAKILLKQPQVLLLDEPTNHLDIVSIEWLENFLVQYKGAIILISHDRRFLDAVTKKTFEISLNKLNSYPAPYSEYCVLKEERYEQQLAAYENQQKMIADTEKFIERFRYKATKSVQVQSRIKQLDKIERLEIEKKDTGAFKISFPPSPRAGTVVLKTNHLTKKYGEKTILSDVIFQIERGDKIALVGKNGEGKSTFIKCVLNETNYSGEIQLGHNVRIGYFAQNQDEILNENLTVFETLDAIATGEIRTKVRDILGAFYFSGEDVDKKVRVLSGGERNRLAMAKLMLEPYNLLILDEPTNHLDIASKAVLKQALQKYDGTLILVSHDRDFLDGLTTHIFEVKQTKVREIIGDLHNYLQQLHTEILTTPKDSSKDAVRDVSTTTQKLNYEQKKERERELRKQQSALKKTEERVQELENQLHELNTYFIEAAGSITPDDYKRHAALQEKLDEAMAKWEKIAMELE